MSFSRNLEKIILDRLKNLCKDGFKVYFLWWSWRSFEKFYKNCNFSVIEEFINRHFWENLFAIEFQTFNSWIFFFLLNELFWVVDIFSFLMIFLLNLLHARKIEIEFKTESWCELKNSQQTKKRRMKTRTTWIQWSRKMHAWCNLCSNWWCKWKKKQIELQTGPNVHYWLLNDRQKLQSHYEIKKNEKIQLELLVLWSFAW